MRIKNIDGLSAKNLQDEVKRGGRFLFFPFTISLLVVTFKQTSGVYLVRGHEKATTKALPFLLISLFFGWWGIPFGPKYTLDAISACYHGGKDVTEDVMATVAGYVLYKEAEKEQQDHTH